MSGPGLEGTLDERTRVGVREVRELVTETGLEAGEGFGLALGQAAAVGLVEDFEDALERLALGAVDGQVELLVEGIELGSLLGSHRTALGPHDGVEHVLLCLPEALDLLLFRGALGIALRFGPKRSAMPSATPEEQEVKRLWQAQKDMLDAMTKRPIQWSEPSSMPSTSSSTWPSTAPRASRSRAHPRDWSDKAAA